MSLFSRLRLARFALFGTKETLHAHGPLVPIPKHPPCVTIRRGYDSATISWEPGRIIACQPAYDALIHRLQANAMLGDIAEWIAEECQRADPQPERQGGVRFGRVLHVPLEQADALAELVRSHLALAVAEPLTLAEFNRRFPTWQATPTFPADSLPPAAEPPGFIVPWVCFGMAEHEPFTVIPWTGATRKRASESLDSPEWEGIAPDGERLWFSGSESVLLKPEGRQGRELHEWLAQKRTELLAAITDGAIQSGEDPKDELAAKLV